MRGSYYFRYLSSGYRRYHTLARFYALPYIGFMLATALAERLCATNHIVKLMIFLCCAGFLLGTLMFIRRQRNRNPVILIFCGALLLVFAMYLAVQFYRSIPTDYAAIENGYVRYARTYEGVPYRKGGETRYGADTVGIAKASLFRSGLEYGLKKHDLKVLVSSAGLWWRCLENRDLLRGDLPYAYKTGSIRGPRDPDIRLLEQGDMLYDARRDRLYICLGGGMCIGSCGEEGAVIRGVRTVCRDAGLARLKWKIRK